MDPQRVTDEIGASTRWPDIHGASPMAAIYMLRTVQQHHVQLSVMADFKASILITAASILVTAFVAVGSSVGVEPGIVAATPFVIASLGFAIYAVIPKASTGKSSGPGTSGFNLFFFGHFRDLSQDEYIDEMMEIIGDSSQTFAHQVKDIYQLGTYLSTSKYRYLRWAYLALFAGIVIGAITQLIDFMI